MVVQVVAVVLGTAAVLAGIVGCVVPVVPGPLLAVAALWGVSIAGGWMVYSPFTLGLWTVLAVGAQILDSVLPARAAGKAGADRAGVWGSVVGMLLGTVFFPPLGVFIGAFLGALVGELLFHTGNKKPLSSALAVFRGTLAGIVWKLAVTGGILVVFVRGALRLFQLQ
jgi:uncharacterized protein